MKLQFGRIDRACSSPAFTAGGAYPAYIRRYFRENGISFRVTDEDRAALKNTVDVAAVSYCSGNCATAHPEEADTTRGNIASAFSRRWRPWTLLYLHHLKTGKTQFDKL